MIFLLLIVTKIVLATLLALLFVAAPLAIALWPLPETSWLARTVLQSLIGVLLWPVVWALCFALFAVIGASAFTPERARSARSWSSRGCRSPRCTCRSRRRSCSHVRRCSPA